MMRVKVQYEGQCSTLQLFVVRGADPSLLGQGVLAMFVLIGSVVDIVQRKEQPQPGGVILSQYTEDFSEALGTMNRF